MKENTLGVKMSMAGIQADADSPAAENAVQKTYPGSEVVMENPGVEPLARRCYPDAYSMLGALRLAAPHTEFLYAQGYPYAGNEESGYDAALQIAKDADLVICTLGGHYGWNASCTTGEGIDAMHIGLPVCQERFLENWNRCTSRLSAFTLTVTPSAAIRQTAYATRYWRHGLLVRRAVRPLPRC